MRGPIDPIFVDVDVFSVVEVEVVFLRELRKEPIVSWLLVG